MKKTLFIVAAVSLLFAACNKVDVQSAKKGMTLSAIVDDNIKATIEKDGSKWHFKWQNGDIVKVTDPNGTSYDFTYDGTSFKCETAVPAEGEWTAVYPKGGEPESYANQGGTIVSAMEKYYMTGSCTSDGSPKLSMTMIPQCAILAHTNDYFYDQPIFIFYNDDTQHYTQLGSSTKNKTSYYIIPAGKNVSIAIGERDNVVLSGKTVEAGKVYTYTGHMDW